MAPMTVRRILQRSNHIGASPARWPDRLTQRPDCLVGVLKMGKVRGPGPETPLTLPS